MTRKRFSSRRGAIRAVFRFVAGHWARQPIRIAVIMTAFMLATLSDVATPYFAGALVDAISRGGAGEAATWDAALNAFLAMVGLGVIAVGMRLISFGQIIPLTLTMMAAVTRDGFARIQRFSTDWHANSFAGSTVRKISRGMWALDILNDTVLIAVFPSLIMLVGSTILLGAMWPLMGAIIGVGSLIYIAVVVATSVFWVAPAASLANSWDTRMGGALADAISCNAVVKGFGGEVREDDRLSKVITKWRSRTRRTWWRGTINGIGQQGMLVIFRTAIIGAALVLWAAGEADAGDVALVLTSFFVLQGYLRDIGMHVRNLQRSVNDMEELVQIMDEPLGVSDRPDAKPIAIEAGAIHFRDVTFQYGKHLTPLYRDFDVTIPAGQRVGLVGHSGSGKTTFVKLVQRLYDLTGGTIEIDGQDIANATQASLRQQIAIVQQEPILFHRSLAENIAYARPGASRHEIEQAARLANAHEFIAELPKAYETLVGERGVKLSGGERQRVALARAFLADAPILILDEATSSLDSESEVLIQQAMERLMEGRTTIVIAHRLSTVRKLDRLLVFDRGRIVEEGTHSELIRAEHGIYRRLFERQALELTQGLVQAAE